MPVKPPSINLYKLNQKSFIDKFIDWALTAGRLAIISTEVIALSAFLYRFNLDRQLVDLHDQITQKETYVNLLKANEDKYRNLQERLAAAKQLDQSATSKITLLSDVFNLAQNGFTISDVRMTDESIRINANAVSIDAVSQFVNGLKKLPQADTVSVDKIENKTSSAIISVSITVTIKKQPVRT